jgi:hypothetical protein
MHTTVHGLDNVEDVKGLCTEGGDEGDKMQVVLNVGGVNFTTTGITLRTCGIPYWTSVSQVVNDIDIDVDGTIVPSAVFIDRDPFMFRHILNYVRAPTIWGADQLEGLSDGTKRQLIAECNYYCMDDMIQAIQLSMAVERKTRETRLAQVFQDLQGEKGKDGRHGNIGPQGCQGRQGYYGTDGKAGPRGANGTDGKSGPRGANGKDNNDEKGWKRWLIAGGK